MTDTSAAPRIVAAELTAPGTNDGGGRSVRLEWDNRDRASLEALWLRDNCPRAGDRMACGELCSLADLDPELRLEEATVDAEGALHLGFSDGHHAVFDGAWLHTHAPGHRRRSLCDVEPWLAPKTLHEFGFADVLGSPAAHCALLDEVLRCGAALVTEVPPEASGTEQLARLFGYIRHTDFGRLFDIVTEPRAWTASQSADALDPHTDDPYRYTPSGASILHCVTASPGGGGDSILVDGFAVADELRRVDRRAFDLLSTLDVPFVYRRDHSVAQGDAVHLRAHARIIRTDRDGEVVGIRFHERAMAPLDLDDELIEPCYRALIAFTRMLRSARFQLVRRLAAGEALLFDNQRVLHGRTGFHGDPAGRHFRLCTIDRDQFHSTLRRLREQTGVGDPLAKLPAGNLA